jgi:acyl carrier protein
LDLGFLSDGAGGLDDIELVMAVEEAFNVKVPDGDAEKIRKLLTTQDLTNYIEHIRKRGKGGN